MSAPGAIAQDVGPVQLAAAIAQRAEKTSFADLERWGHAAAKRNDREGLRRLQYVSLVLMNQSEFDKFDYWNELLARKAKALGDHRYMVMARLNGLKAKHDQGDDSGISEIARIAATETDWAVRIHAIVFKANVLTDQNESGEALKQLSEAQDLIPEADPAAADAQSDIWDTIGLALMKLKDLGGSAKAFQRADFEFADQSFPRPDFDNVYNMAHMAVDIGDGDMARQLATIHHHLTLRSDLPHLDAWDDNLCAMVAGSFGSPGEVLGCLKGLDAKLTGAQFLAPRMLPMRAIAEARVGDLEHAEADLARIQALKASGGFEKAAFSREPEAEAELLAARGKSAEAFEMLRAYNRQHGQDEAHMVNAGVRQLTGELQTQLETARKSVVLQQAVVRSQRWLELVASLLIVGAIAVLVWQRRQAGRLRIAQQRAELASQSKSEFLSNMSHEIRTPLNGVVGVADLLASAGMPERERKMAELIRDSGRTLERLLSDVLDLAKVEAGQLTIEQAPFQAGDLIRAVAELNRPKAEAKGLVLNTRIAPDLESWFLGDSVRVRQILTNLTSNAVKFTEKGSVSIVAESPAPGVIRLSVADTGVGFDAAAKGRLFGRFQQADGSITRRFGGTGLGLAICRQLATLMDGTLDCDSVPGRGSKFWFEARFQSAADGVGLPEDETLSLPEERALHVLVADDHPTNLIVVRMMLEQLGIEISTVENGAEAVQAAVLGGYDVILMDMQMPVMDGLEAVRRIRQHEIAIGARRIPILMLSANAGADHRDESRVAGADGHVAKPITLAALTLALAEVLDDGEEQPLDQVA
jgi:signal transduction histidine kinase/ActR/RegA family two-component response regulator